MEKCLSRSEDSARCVSKRIPEVASVLDSDAFASQIKAWCTECAISDWKTENTEVHAVDNCLPVLRFGRFSFSWTIKQPKATACMYKCEAPAVETIRLWRPGWVYPVLEAICCPCILFGSFLPYGLINNAGRLDQPLAPWWHQNAKQRSWPLQQEPSARGRLQTGQTFN